MSTSPQPPSVLCEQAQEAISALLDNEYIQAQQALLAQHLPTCADCQAYQDSMEHLTLSLQKLDDVPVPAGLELRIMERIALESGNGSSKGKVAARTHTAAPRRGSWLKAAPIAAAALLLAVALPWMQQTLNANNQPADMKSHMVAQRPATANNPTTAVEPVEQSTTAPQEKLPEDGSATSTQVRPSDKSNSPEVAPKTKDVRRPASSIRTTIATAQPASEATQSNTRQQRTDATEVASALPATLSLDNTYASSTESDVYYDPVSSIVEF